MPSEGVSKRGATGFSCTNYSKSSFRKHPASSDEVVWDYIVKAVPMRQGETHGGKNTGWEEGLDLFVYNKVPSHYFSCSFVTLECTRAEKKKSK